MDTLSSVRIISVQRHVPYSFSQVKDDFLMNPLIQGKSGTTPDMSRNAFFTNQGTNEDDSQSDPHPEAGIFGNQTMRKSGQKDRRDNCTVTLVADHKISTVAIVIWLSSQYFQSWCRKVVNNKRRSWKKLKLCTPNFKCYERANEQRWSFAIAC